MLSSNAFAAVSGSLPAGFMQWYVGLMIVAVIVGTVADMIHKGSAKYFFANARKTRAQGKPVNKASIAVKTLAVDVLASGEFCNPRRRVAHLLTMYGFILYVVTTAVMVFVYPTAATPTPALVPQLWWLGGLMAMVGGYWFWFFIRVDVAAEGSSPLRLMRADLFILSLLASVTAGLLWAWLQASGSAASWPLFGLYLLATTVLFGGVYWSKFAHMFFKPAAAFDKRLAEADGTNMNLPTLGRDDPAQRERHSMELLRNAPMDMGLGIKREAPRHY
ncbi:hypothetical protein BURK1_00534 [Burkholderiales bacterium]|nr:hypothetical protein BURK1_00534 [Burkholderiales bacterium]